MIHRVRDRVLSSLVGQKTSKISINFTLTARERSDNLSLHIHYNNCIRTVTDYNECTLFTVRSAAPNDLYVPEHSVGFKLHTLTVPSEDAL